MAEEPTPTTAEGGVPEIAPLTINAQYVKDLSFEIPNAPGIFGEMQNTPPEVNIDIKVNAQKLSDNVYEVMLGINSSCEVGEHKGFILELVYAGTFTLNIPEEHIQAILLIECPRLLFPFARNIIADVTRNGGFPPVMLGIVDFVAMFQQRVDENNQA
ncbi:protein-export chaperone SecB [Thalassospiraceae bacterium LMO-JJ14]|nr:protein-export chaperone SecB [Thalassospiraceae bacterium LMO-JJ14]